MKFAQSPSPHIRKRRSVRAIMYEVCLALVPAALVHVYFFGPGLILNSLVAVSVALSCEYLMLRMRKQPIAAFLGDGSALLAALLLAFALPPLTPWWVTATAAAFAMIVAKHLYGGLGFNTFNPAMAGYAVVLVSFPTELALWTSPGLAGAQLDFLQSVQVTLTGALPEAYAWDQLTQATPLDAVQIGLSQGAMLSELFYDPSLSVYGTQPWIAINLAILAGGIWLLVRKLISWHIPVGVIAGVTVSALAGRMLDSDAYSPVFFHLLSGSALIGAFFIATDPVSAATSRRGKIIYALGIGVLIYSIRTWGSYPDGVAFAVLFMNMLVPLIDHFTIPRAYGHAR
ncbi:MAG: RnfABCDGE type electron transport complex subunit D [Gammaproteobacteria bacterium]